MAFANRGRFADLVRSVEAQLCVPIETADRRFRSLRPLVPRFRAAAQRLLEEGVPALRQFAEVHNELCVAHLIQVDASEPAIVSAEYEPPIGRCARRFDFRLAMTDGSERWIEVKTIHPESSDRWEQYESATRRGLFPDHAALSLAKGWLGGELFHNAFASRSAILRYTLETEEKIKDCLPESSGRVVILALFSNGFKWHVDDLEDFLCFYRTGRHYAGDPFQDMERHYVERRDLELQRSIDHFMYLERAELDVVPFQVVWSVRPPHWPS